MQSAYSDDDFPAAVVPGSKRKRSAADDFAAAAERSVNRAEVALASIAPPPTFAASGLYDDEEGGPRRPAPKKRRVTRGERDIMEVLGNAATEGDVERQMEKDTEHLKWLPVQSERVEELERTIGVPGPRTQCYACCYGRGTYAAEETNIDRLRELHDECVRDEMPPEAIAREMYLYFEAYVRKRANRARARLGEAPMPEWTVATIHHHITGKHSANQGAYLRETVMEMRDLQTFLYNNGVYQCNALTPEDRRPSRKDIEMYNTVVKTCHNLTQTLNETEKKAKGRSEGASLVSRTRFCLPRASRLSHARGPPNPKRVYEFSV